MLSYVSLFLLSLIHLALSDIPNFNNSEEYQFSTYGTYPRQRFFSDPDVIAPVANVIIPAQEGVSPNKLITWSPHGEGVPAHGPQLLDTDTLSVVFQGPTFQEDNFGITVQSCNGSDYLVWWSGTNIDGRAAGQYYIFNSTYHNVANVSAIGLKKADAHDVFITPDCHAVITVNEPKPFELENYDLADNSWLQESYFQEIDIETNELVFQWRASDHIPLEDGRWLPWIGGWDTEWQGVYRQNPWDFFHINSVEKDHTGNYLISARHTNSLYYLDGVTGAVLWTLGGEKNQFQDLNNGYATDFSWQHHARWANEELTMISVFDDRNCRYIKSADPISRGALISLDFEEMTASLAGNYRAPSHIEAFRKGSMQVLENRNVLLGFGNEPAWTEYLPNGTIIWDVHMGPVMAGYDRETADNYRSYKVDWTGKPHWNPKIALGPKVNVTAILEDEPLWSPDVANDTVYFSWNGATEVRGWMLFSARHPLEIDSMASLLLTVNRTGFETGFPVGANMTGFLRAVAVAGDGEMLGATPILDLRTGVTWTNAAELLKAHPSEWQDEDHLRTDLPTVWSSVLENDGFEALEAEWDALRREPDSKLGLFGCGMLVVLVAFAALGWFGWRQLRGAFETKYREKGYHDVAGDDVEGVAGVDEKFRAGVDVKEGEDEGKRQGLFTPWR